jgi:uncharacterized Zn finger protein
MEAAQVNRVFAWAQQRYARTACPSCGGRSTSALVYMEIVSVACDECGEVAPQGRLTRRPSHA